MSADLDRIIAELLELKQQQGAVSVPDFDEKDRAEIQAALEVADLLWEAGHGAPPLEKDPIAAMLGLVVDPHCMLDPKALTRARKSARLNAGQLAERLAARGWEVTGNDVFKWENRSTAGVTPALIQAIAEEIGTSVEHLTTDTQPTTLHNSVSEVSQTPRFKELAHRWAHIRGVSLDIAASTLQSRMLATVHRGQHPDTEQWLQSLEELVRAMENKSSQ